MASLKSNMVSGFRSFLAPRAPPQDHAFAAARKEPVKVPGASLYPLRSDLRTFSQLAIYYQTTLTAQTFSCLVEGVFRVKQAFTCDDRVLHGVPSARIPAVVSRRCGPTGGGSTGSKAGQSPRRGGQGGQAGKAAGDCAAQRADARQGCCRCTSQAAAAVRHCHCERCCLLTSTQLMDANPLLQLIAYTP